MRTRIGIRLNTILERFVPERRVFLKSDSDTRFVRLSAGTQIMSFAGAAALVCWAIVAAAILLMDSIGAGNIREQAKRDQINYLERLELLAQQRDQRAQEALTAQERFNAALDSISAIQSDLLASETRRMELETGLEVVQKALRSTLRDRNEIRTELDALQEDRSRVASGALPGEAPAHHTSILADALARTAEERDRIEHDAQEAVIAADTLATEIELIKQQNEQIFRQLEEAVAISVEPLDKMFRAAGMPTDRIIEQVRRGYSGQGGPLTPISFSTRSKEIDPDTERANRLLQQLDQLNLYRIAAEQAPFASPVHGNYRFTSGFGPRRDPFTGGRRMHSGLDFAGPHGTPITATADGTVTFAGWASGYGRMVKIQHSFGIETRYAHLSSITVKVGQKVSRGDKIGGMGSTGRSTGVHLHYEVRVGEKAVNPMVYIKAANNVF